MKAAIIIVMLTTLGGLLSQCTKETTQKTPTTLNIDTTTISFGAIEKIGEVKIQNLIISKTGDEIVTWHATTDKSWLQLNQSSGEIYSKNDTIKLSLNSTALGFGDYTGEITITSSINNAMQTPVKIKVKVSITSCIIEGYVLNQNEVWSGNILLRGDIKIPSGYTLTINPGTKIMIAARGLLFDGGFNTNKVDIYVFGNLIMNGTSGKPIQIMSSEDNATNEDWWGIGLTGSSRVEMTYCSMSNCSYGLFIFSDVSTAPVVNHCLFTNLQSMSFR